MKNTLIILLLIIISTTASAAEPVDQSNKYFDAFKLYLDKDYSLNDALEFTVFDMTEVKFINESKQATVPITPVPQPNKTTVTAAGTGSGSLPNYSSTTPGAVDETRPLLEQLPRDFFTHLKNHVVLQKVPVTLYSSRSPTYAKPLQLDVKIKQIYLKPEKTGKNSERLQPVSMRIYGQVKDKKTDQVLFKYYDSGETEFPLGHNQARVAFNTLSDNLMRDLALFLKTKY